MLVVSADNVRRNEIFEAPEKLKALSLDAKMQEVLNRQDLTDEEKVRLYEQVLNEYLHYRRQATTIPSAAQLTPQSSPSLYNVDDVIASVPKAFRGKAEQLARRVLREMKWSPSGELVVDDRAIPGTNVVDLVNDAVRYRKTVRPKGREEFVEAMSKLNLPRELVGNREVWEQMERFRQTGEVLSPPKAPSLPSSYLPREAPAFTRWSEEEEEEETPMIEGRPSRVDQPRRRSKVARWLRYT